LTYVGAAQVNQKGQSMNWKWMAVVVPALALLGLPALAEESPFKTQQDKVSYAMGMEMGMSFRQQGIEVNVAMLMKGLQDVISGSAPLLAEADLRTTLTQFQVHLRQKQVDAMKMYAERNQVEGETFLAENKNKEGVVTLPSGLQYRVITMGAGKKPTATDKVECNYRGALIDGTEFDSSYRRGQPATFQVSGVMRGWTEALQLMPVGSKWQLFIPSDLAYGASGVPPLIGPNATLVFEVELLAIK
jgi:FKBP-type peptidyl-prolyl cis-trans isomerase FklB